MIFSNLYAMGTQPNAIFDLFRYLFFFIDGIIYSLIPAIYGCMFYLYDLRTLFSDNGEVLSKLITNLTNIIYSFLAIAMFFRTAVSLLTMLVDPSKISDKEKGASKIVINIILCLALIVAVPKVFDASRKIQSKVMENHVIEKMVLGEDFGENDKYTLGHELSLSLWSVFLNPYNANGVTLDAYNSVFNNQNALGIGAVWPVTKLLVVINSVDGIPILSDVVGKFLPGLNGMLNIFGEGSHYQLSYVWLLSTIAGAYVLWAFVKMMIDIAYRSIKFFALELLSPIAIISYIDPSSSKKGLFSKWLKETWSTYLSLFVRIFVFAIATVLLRAFNLSDIASNSLVNKTGNTLIVKLFFILAAVAFFKNAPKFIDELFGTTMSKDSDTKFAKGLLGGLVSGAALAVPGAIHSAVVAKATGQSAVKGAITGAWNSAKKGYAAGKKGGFVGVMSAGYGDYKDINKKYGYAVDRDRERRIKAFEAKVDEVDRAKTNAVRALDENGGAAYAELLRKGATYNGRKYGQALSTDAKLSNTIKKNYGGLARDEYLHAGDEQYLSLRRLVFNQKNGEAMASRTFELAQDDYQTNNSTYQNSTDKRQYVVDFINETRDRKINLFRNADDDTRIKMAVKELGITEQAARSMSAADLNNEFTIHARNEATAEVTVVSTMGEAQLDAQFIKENGARIEATYGHSYGDIASDAAKAKGDAEAASKALDDYVKSRGLGNIDSDYAIADSRHKARKQEEARRRANNGNNTP